MDRCILIVDDQHDILRLLHSALDTLKLGKLKVFEVPSGEEALLESARNKVELLISDYKLPGMSGVELMRKVRARHPESRVIFITGLADRAVREEILSAGAEAVFDKPIPLADFLDMVERSLGLPQRIFPAQGTNPERDARYAKVSELLSGFRQEVQADAVFLLNDRGLVELRDGRLHDASMEVSLASTLMAIHSTSQKVARASHQDTCNSYHVFSGGDHDLLFIPVNPTLAMLVAGRDLAAQKRILFNVNALLTLREQVLSALNPPSVPSDLQIKKEAALEPVQRPDPVQEVDPLAGVAPAPEMEALLRGAVTIQKVSSLATDEFWDQAVDQFEPRSPDLGGLSMEEAKRLGIIPGGN